MLAVSKELESIAKASKAPHTVPGALIGRLIPAILSFLSKRVLGVNLEPLNQALLSSSVFIDHLRSSYLVQAFSDIVFETLPFLKGSMFIVAYFFTLRNMLGIFDMTFFQRCGAWGIEIAADLIEWFSGGSSPAAVI